jgi:hypothetical protein
VYREWKKTEFQKQVFYMNLETKRLRRRPRNRWQDEVRGDGRLVGGKEWKGTKHRGMEEAPENSKESSHSAHANGINAFLYSPSIDPTICKLFHAIKKKGLLLIMKWVINCFLHLITCKSTSYSIPDRSNR